MGYANASTRAAGFSNTSVVNVASTSDSLDPARSVLTSEAVSDVVVVTSPLVSDVSDEVSSVLASDVVVPESGAVGGIADELVDGLVAGGIAGFWGGIVGFGGGIVGLGELGPGGTPGNKGVAGGMGLTVMPTFNRVERV